MSNTDYMPEGSKSSIPPEVHQLYELGQQGKLWTISIVFSYDGETRSVKHRNLTSNKVIQLREDIFKIGFLHPIGPHSWRVVMPLDIDRVELDRQSGYFSG